MIEGLRPYPEYRDSGVPWVGRVPGHWETPRVKAILREVDRRSSDGVGELLSMTKVRGLVPRRDRTDKSHGAETLVGYKKYEAGQVVMNRMQAWNGMFGAGRIDGLVSPDYAVFELIGEYSLGYVAERLKSPDLVGRYVVESKGIGTGFNRLYSDRFGAITLSLPPPEEQAAIARYLDHAHRRIERFLRAKRRLIAVLGEQRRAIIHQAVTRGVAEGVPLKDSGVPWIGAIPAHWDVRRLKFITSKIVDCLHATPRYSETGAFPAIRTADIAPGVVRLATARRIEADEYTRWVERLEPVAGDILYSREGERFGIAACVPENVRLCISQRMMVFRVRPECGCSCPTKMR